MQTKTKLPQFKGNPIVPRDIEFPEADFLRGEFGRAVFDEYQARVKADYDNNSALTVLSYDDVVKGSNPFAVALVNDIVMQEGLRTATPADLERVLKADSLNLRGFYEDSALALRSEEDPNEYLAKNLAEQVRARQILKYPVIIPLNRLELVKDSDSDYGLGFRLREDVEIIHAPVLNQGLGNFSSEDIDEKTGLPKKSGNGNRTLYTRESGLSRLFLSRGLGLDSASENLAYSYSDGRVVVVSAEGTSQKTIKEYITQLEQKRDAEKTEIDNKFNQALKVLKP
jgi:hypothetical protein